MILQICSYFWNSKVYQHLFKAIDEREYVQYIYIPLSVEKSFETDFSLQYGKVDLQRPFREWEKFRYHTKTEKITQGISGKNIWNEVQLSHAHSLFTSGNTAWRLKEMRGVPYVVTVRSTDLRTFFKKAWHLRKVGVRILLEAEVIVFLSYAHREELLSRYVPAHYVDHMRNKSVVIPNGIADYWHQNSPDLETAFATNKEEGEEEAIKLLYVGQFIPRKYLSYLVEAVDRLNAQGKKTTLKLIGNGPLFPKLEKMAEERPYVQLVDWISRREELLSHYRQADIFVMPSERETFGLAYIEAMSQGIPIIYGKNEGVDGYFSDGEVGEGVVLKKAEAIEAAVLKMVSQYEHYATTAYAASKEFTWKKASAMHLERYHSLCHHRLRRKG